MEAPSVHQRTLIPGHEGSGGKFLLITMKRICSRLTHVENVILTSREVHDTRSSILRISLQMTELAGINEKAADDRGWVCLLHMCHYCIIMQPPAPLTGCCQLICLETSTNWGLLLYAVTSRSRSETHLVMDKLSLLPFF